ncbi:MAG: hypothetical protein KF777_01050 [Planctomycetaceae bacterium]|nr:hypothetical protein [Planctomycetaceae bacterium]
MATKEEIQEMARRAAEVRLRLKELEHRRALEHREFRPEEREEVDQLLAEGCSLRKQRLAAFLLETQDGQ